MRILRRDVEKPEISDQEPAKLEPISRPPLASPLAPPAPHGAGPSLMAPPPRPLPTPDHHGGTSFISAPVPPPTAAPVNRSHVAFLDHGAKIKGNLQFDCPIQIDGQIEGEITGKQSITIGETARVVATIRSATVIIEGKVNGDVIATERIELRPKAKVLGNLTAPALVIQEGAQYEGRCSMTLQPEVKPVVHGDTSSNNGSSGATDEKTDLDLGGHEHVSA